MPPENPESRRDFLGGIFTSAGKVVTRRIGKSEPVAPTTRADGFLNLLRPPDSIRLFSHGGYQSFEELRGGLWQLDDVLVKVQVRSEEVGLSVEASSTKLEWLAIRWQGEMAGIRRFLAPEPDGNRWAWRPGAPDRLMPGHFLAHDGKRAHGYAVQAKSNARAFWTADHRGATLWLDVRSGAEPLLLNGRELELCQIVCREGNSEETPFQAYRALCGRICPRPRLAGHPLYGLSPRRRTETERAWEAAKILAELSPNVPNVPFLVMDHSHVSDVDSYVSRARDLGVRPGLTVRPLQWNSPMPAEWRGGDGTIDPSHPDAAEHVSESLAGLVSAGIEMIRIGGTDSAWAAQLGKGPSQTSAEIARETYERIRAAAGQAYLWGLDTVPDAATGLFELNESSSSGLLDRVNRLAFRGAENGLLGGVVPGIVDLTGNPSQAELDFLLLAGLSGSPLFVDLEPAALRSPEWSILRSALEAAAAEQEQAEPIDWINSTAPQKWRLPGGRRQFDWSGPDGSVPDLS